MYCFCFGNLFIRSILCGFGACRAKRCVFGPVYDCCANCHDAAVWYNRQSSSGLSRLGVLLRSRVHYLRYCCSNYGWQEEVSTAI